MDISALFDFNLVAIHGGFGKASRASGRSKATLARHVSDLEASLELRLIERGSHHLRLTEEGRHLHERTVGLLGEIAEIGESLQFGLTEPRGQLVVSAPLLFSHAFLGQLAADFAATFPNVSLTVLTDDRLIDLVQEGVDVAIRVNPSDDEELIGRCFAHDDMVIVAHPRIAASLGNQNGEVRSIPVISMPNRLVRSPWSLTIGGQTDLWQPDVRLQLSSLLMIRDAVRAGAGAAALPRSVIRTEVEQGSLVVLGDVTDSAVDYWILHQSRRLVSTKVTAFTEFIIQSFPDRRL
ncbi:LysR family transcriptional regulator [Sinorhizobium meliloti]|uniref:LysR family transcriptional regulator n=1 Tax=Rhizobium meliloti TaxID=382 RepID=A0A2J0YTA6_RHIML|nr:LysR family transcriptional regulator [Sinorhizobium meliloti]PJR09120.1 LysR family transcriptional regulator [Sinorhizobium meliloti]